MQKVPILTLHDGGKIPQLGFGTVHNTLQGMIAALKAGFRHIDTAQYYQIQDLVGQAIKITGIPRDQLFITSKVWKTHLTKQKATQSLNQTLRDLSVDYVDLLLIHWPYIDGINFKDGEALKKGRIEAWKTFIQFKKQGKVKHIGVSNFLPKHIDQLIEATGEIPVVNQIINHPFKVLDQTIEYCRKKKILVEAWSPLAQERHCVMINPDLKSIANKHKKSVSDVILRWITQNGLITFPRSLDAENIQRNLRIFDFQLQEEDMKRIDEMHTQKENVDEFQLKDMYVQ